MLIPCWFIQDRQDEEFIALFIFYIPLKLSTVLLHQQKQKLRPADRTRVRTGSIRPMHPVRPDCPADIFSHLIHPTRVRILWLRPETSGATKSTRGTQRIYSSPDPPEETWRITTLGGPLGRLVSFLQIFSTVIYISNSAVKDLQKINFIKRGLLRSYCPSNRP